MTVKHLATSALRAARTGLVSVAVFQLAVGNSFAAPLPQPASNSSNDSKTTSPIKHVIVIIGENRSFDHVYATYVPKSGDSINNLLSEGIIQLDSNKNAVPGPNFNNAQQFFATDTDTFLLAPPTKEYPKNVLPAHATAGSLTTTGLLRGRSGGWLRYHERTNHYNRGAPRLGNTPALRHFRRGPAPAYLCPRKDRLRQDYPAAQHDLAAYRLGAWRRSH